MELNPHVEQALHLIRFKCEPAKSGVLFSVQLPTELAILLPGLIATAQTDADMQRVASHPKAQILLKQLVSAIMGKHTDENGDPLSEQDTQAG